LGVLFSASSKYTSFMFCCPSSLSSLVRNSIL
ncbi:hypothetical protein X975_14231, partial [Stegodyphus mimosarum]